MLKKIIVWDLGATKCAAAVITVDETASHFACEKTCSIKLREVSSLGALIQRIEQALAFSMPQAAAICIGAAGIFDGEQLTLQAGYPYPMPLGILAKQQHWPRFAVIHDYAPIVCGTFLCDPENPAKVRRLNQAPLNKFARRVALGVGTGLGLKDGVLFANGDFWLGHNEMGHIGSSYVHPELVKFLVSSGELKEDEPLSFEKVLSGNGTLRLHRFLHPECRLLSPEDIGEHIRAGEADDTLALFAWYLGLFIGTVQLSFMPEGGIWITGGVIQNHADVFDQANFNKGIESLPAYLSQRQQFPLFVLQDPHHAFFGAAYYAVKRLLS